MLDRVLDKGIVIDAWARISLVGIDLIAVNSRLVVSVDAFVAHNETAAMPTTRLPASGELVRQPAGWPQIDQLGGQAVEVVTDMVPSE